MSQYTGQNGELNFENDVIKMLFSNGWNYEILNYVTVKQHDEYNPNNITSLEGNFRKILFENNRTILRNVPLTNTEFDQILSKINNANTPVKANILINGNRLGIVRDIDSKDKEHAGKAVFLDIFNQASKASGNTKYQIAHQIRFKTDKYTNDGRGDVTLLINGLPVIHIELKSQDVDVKKGCNQIVKYAGEGIFTGLMGLVQVFFSINPNEVVYFSNFGKASNYNEAFVFHWADENNNIINDWQTIIKGGRNAMLSIPEAHDLVGCYTVADKNKDVLKVMRSYQYNAVRRIRERTEKQQWGTINPLGGICWCTTGGGKTMSAFKAGQLLRDTNKADKIVFVIDRTELNMQTLDDYNSFSRDGEEVQETVSTIDLFRKLKSTNWNDRLIITSIQKMNNISSDVGILNESDIECIKKNRIVFIVDEAQRSQFGEMHENVKSTFPEALYFGFTGTPIMGELDSDDDTRNVFGKYISVYTLANGIRDKNVLSFEAVGIKTYDDDDLRKAVAMDKCKINSLEDIKDNEDLLKLYKETYNLNMVSTKKNEKIVKGIEDYIPQCQYDNDNHRKAVISYILKKWEDTSNYYGKTRFHAIFSTSSIEEAIKYYRLFKEADKKLNITTLFDPHISNDDYNKVKFKLDAIKEILIDYNDKYNTSFNRDTDPDLKSFKRDIMARLSHKKPYEHIGNNDTIDIVIVVNQLLTGFDSQFVNTLYLDDVIETSNLIQAISRTNRIYNWEKPFGKFVYFRKIHTMKKNLDYALKLYCEGSSEGVMIDSPEKNISNLNNIFKSIGYLFTSNKINNFSKLPDSNFDVIEFRRLFAQLFSKVNILRLQGALSATKIGDVYLKWNSETPNGNKISFNSDTYNVLVTRFKDSYKRGLDDNNDNSPSVPYNLDVCLSTCGDTIMVDYEYIEKHFKTTFTIITDDYESVENKDIEIENFSNNFNLLTERQQVYAKAMLEELKNGKIKPVKGKKFIEYLNEYVENIRNEKINIIADRYGINVESLNKVIKSVSEKNDLNDGQQFTTLCDCRDKQKTMEYYNTTSEAMSVVKMHKDLKKFICEDINNI